MADYYELAATTIQEMQNGLSAGTIVLYFNAAQCSRLVRYLTKAYICFFPNDLYPSQILQNFGPFHEELFRIVKRTQAIVDACSNEKTWLQSVIILADNHEIFMEISCDLQSCVVLFHKTIRELCNVVHVEFSCDLSEALKLNEASESVEDFNLDCLNLLERLRELVNQPTLGATMEQNRHLATYLIERQKCMSNTSGGDETLLQFYSSKWQYPIHGVHLGHGAFASVYKVDWYGITCAKKHFGIAVEDEKLKMEVIKEVSILAKLNHHHVVKLMCISVEPEVSFVMEMMPMTLHSFIKRRWKDSGGVLPFTMAAIIDMMLQIAISMEYLHKQDVVHRDLKSSNILVSPSTVDRLWKAGFVDVKLTDFGLAKTKVNGLIEPTCPKMGSTRWMAPEVFAHNGLIKIDWRKADTYSFAMTCSEILTGKSPFSEGRHTELHRRITEDRERPKVASTCPEYLSSFLDQCWDTNPSVRPCFKDISNTLRQFKDCLLTGSKPLWSPTCVNRHSPSIKWKWMSFSRWY